MEGKGNLTKQEYPRGNAKSGGIGRHVLIYGTGIVIGKLAGFLMLPIYTRFLSTADYGILELLSMTVEVIGTLTAMGIAASVFKFHAQYDLEKDKKEVIVTAEAALLVLGSVATLIGLLLSQRLTNWMFEAGTPVLYFRLFFLMYFFGRMEVVPLLVLRLQERSISFVAVSLGKLLTSLGFNIYFVVVRQMGIEGVLWGNLSASALMGIGLQIFLFTEIKSRPSLSKLRELIRFGFPLSLWFIGNFVLVFSDRYFLNFFVGASAVGIYSLAYRFVNLLSSFVFAPFNLIWGPKRFTLAKDPGNKAVFPSAFFFLNLGVSFMCILITLFVDEVLRIMADPSFFPAHELVPVLILAQVAFQWDSFSNLGLLFKDRTPVLARLSFGAMGVMIVLNLILIPRFGAFGAAWATLLAYGFRYLALLHLSQRTFRIDHGWKRVLPLYGLAVSVILLEAALPSQSLVPSFFTSAILAFAWLVTVWLFIMNPGEREEISFRLRRFIRV